jgi:hypothetical protein
MREQYLAPRVTRVGSVEDLTLAGSPGGVVDICLSVGQLGVSAGISIPGVGCVAATS